MPLWLHGLPALGNGDLAPAVRPRRSYGRDGRMSFPPPCDRLAAWSDPPGQNLPPVVGVRVSGRDGNPYKTDGLQTRDTGRWNNTSARNTLNRALDFALFKVGGHLTVQRPNVVIGFLDIHSIYSWDEPGRPSSPASQNFRNRSLKQSGPEGWCQINGKKIVVKDWLSIMSLMRVPSRWRVRVKR